MGMCGKQTLNMPPPPLVPVACSQGYMSKSRFGW